MGKFASALKHGLDNKFERRQDVEHAEVISAGVVDTNKTIVAILRPDGTQGERKEVLSNFTVWPGLVVRVSIQRLLFGEEEESIVGVESGTYNDSTTMPTLIQEHGQKHGYEQQDETSWLHHYQTYPLRVQALVGLTIRVQDGLYYADGEWRTLNGYLDVDMTPSKPGSGERWVLLSLTSTGSVTLTNGTPAATVLRSSIPDPPKGTYPIGAIKITSATTAITRSMIDDLRHLRPFVEDSLPALGTAYQRIRVNAGATALEAFTDGAGIVVTLGGAGIDIAVADTGTVIIPFDCKVVGWWLVGDNTDNSIVVDVNLDQGFPAAGALPTTASIAGSEKPTLSTDGSASDLDLTTWTQQELAAGDVLELEVDSVGDTIPQVAYISFKLEKQ